MHATHISVGKQRIPALIMKKLTHFLPTSIFATHVFLMALQWELHRNIKYLNEKNKKSQESPKFRNELFCNDASCLRESILGVYCIVMVWTSRRWWRKRECRLNIHCFFLHLDFYDGRFSSLSKSLFYSWIFYCFIAERYIWHHLGFPVRHIASVGRILITILLPNYFPIHNTRITIIKVRQTFNSTSAEGTEALWR